MEAKTVQNVIDELRTQYQLRTSVPLACQLINSAVNELVSLYNTAYILSEIDVVGVVANEPQILATMGIIKVTTEGIPYNRYIADANTVTFRDDGNFKINALIMPINVVAGLDVIPVPIAYHQCVVLYVANHMDQAKDNGQFYQLSREIHNRLSNIKKRGRYVPARAWR